MNVIHSLCKPWKNTPKVVGFLDLVDKYKPSVGMDTATGPRWFPARGLRVGFLDRFRCAWLVFTGQADAFVWPEHDPRVINHEDESVYEYLSADTVIARYGREIYPASHRKLSAAQLVEDHRRLSRRVNELREKLNAKPQTPEQAKFWTQQK